MTEIDEHVERLIVRRIDGELTPAEQDELNAILLRSAEARRMLSDYEQNDRLASSVIDAVAERRWPADDGSARVTRLGVLVPRIGLAAGLAAAAAIAIVTIAPWQTESGPRNGGFPVPGEMTRTDRPVPQDDLIYTSAELSYRGERRIDRDYIGVMDDSRDSMLIFQIDRTRTLRLPTAGDL